MSEHKEEEESNATTASSSSTDLSTTSFLNLSTPLLQSKLSHLQSQSASLASTLTARLASSPSGQSLLHMGPSLSTLPPDLHSLLSAVEPLCKSVADYQNLNQVELVRIVTAGKVIEREVRRGRQAELCRGLWNQLCAAETIVKNENAVTKDAEEDREDWQVVEAAGSLERVAHSTMQLIQQVEWSHEMVTSSLTTPNKTSSANTSSGTATDSSGNTLPSMDTPLPPDTEMAQFVLKIAPRIRSLQQTLQSVLIRTLERLLQQRMQQFESWDASSNDTLPPVSSSTLLQLGHLIRSLALLGLGSTACASLAQIGILPLVKRHLTLSNLDQGGSRGACRGLEALLDKIQQQVMLVWSPVLIYVESMMELPMGTAVGEEMGSILTQVDLITAGCWVPIATAFMTDPTIKMAIFSPGIASTLQANYTTLDTFLSEFASKLLTSATTEPTNESLEESPEENGPTVVDNEESLLASYYYKPSITQTTIQTAQERLYAHPTSCEFAKKWNLPIYYQLRFGEACARLDAALDRVQTEGWHASVFTGSVEDAIRIKDQYGFELPIVMEVYSVLEWLWSPRVFLKPLTHRFLRGAVQMLGRVIDFVKGGLNGSIRFGTIEHAVEEEESSGSPQDSRDVADSSSGGSPGQNGHSSVMTERVVLPPQDNTYVWGENITDVATVAWELVLLESFVVNGYVDAISTTLSSSEVDVTDVEEVRELKSICAEFLEEGSSGIAPIVSSIWNEIIVDILITKCSGPLSAVKGVAATYRMTNRPPPTQASPFVGTILRPVHEFVAEFSERTPAQIGSEWKKKIVSTISSKYESAVSELIETVQRTEEALKNRKVRRAVAGGMSDGEKVKLQLYLDQQKFTESVSTLGIDANEVDGVKSLMKLTGPAESLFLKSQA